jgi:nucleoside 2-deoxyribosyltransferase
MKLFVAASYSTKVNLDTGKVFPEYKEWLEEQLNLLESFGYNVFCALRDDKYSINNDDPAKAVKSDMEQLKQADVLIALLDSKPSTGVQTEIGYALALGLKIILAHDEQTELTWFNQALIKGKLVEEIVLPFTKEKLAL